MKTLIFNGSPKKNGDTATLINELTSHLNGEIKEISYYNNISPCMDCRYCWENTGCCIDDEMQEVYRYLEDCDNVVMASPIWFSSLSGVMMNLTSRIQSIWTAGYFRNKTVPMKEKNGVIILTGAQPETAAVPEKTALIIMKFLNVRCSEVMKIYSLDTNNLPAIKDENALKQCREVAEVLNRNCVKGAICRK